LPRQFAFDAYNMAQSQGSGLLFYCVLLAQALASHSGRHDGEEVTWSKLNSTPPHQRVTRHARALCRIVSCICFYSALSVTVLYSRNQASDIYVVTEVNSNKMLMYRSPPRTDVPPSRLPYLVVYVYKSRDARRTELCGR
jgi:ABC-type Fe3+ transport system permease subunit